MGPTDHGIAGKAAQGDRHFSKRGSMISTSSPTTYLLDAVDILEDLIAQVMQLPERPHDRQYSNDLRRAISDMVAQIGAHVLPAFDDPKSRYALQAEFLLLRAAMGRYIAPPRRRGMPCPNGAADGPLKGMGLASARFINWVRTVTQYQQLDGALAGRELEGC